MNIAQASLQLHLEVSKSQQLHMENGYMADHASKTSPDFKPRRCLAGRQGEVHRMNVGAGASWRWQIIIRSSDMMSSSKNHVDVVHHISNRFTGHLSLSKFIIDRSTPKIYRYPLVN
jgi:hypothetical protein